MLGRIGNELLIGTEAVILLGNPLLVRASYPIIGVHHAREKSWSHVDLRWIVIQGIHDLRASVLTVLTMGSSLLGFKFVGLFHHSKNWSIGGLIGWLIGGLSGGLSFLVSLFT